MLIIKGNYRRSGIFPWITHNLTKYLTATEHEGILFISVHKGLIHHSVFRPFIHRTFTGHSLEEVFI